MDVLLLLDEGMDSAAIARRLKRLSTHFVFSVEAISRSFFEGTSDSYGFDPNALVTSLRNGFASNKGLIVACVDRELGAPGFAVSQADRVGISMCRTIGLDPSKIATLAFVIALELSDATRYCGLVERLNRGLDAAISSVDGNEGEQLRNVRFACVPALQALMTHGIRTYAHWLEETGSILTEEAQIETTLRRYRFLDTASFLMSKDAQLALATELLVALVRLRDLDEEAGLVVVAHSFGSLLIVHALKIANDLGMKIDIRALILNASILPQSFDWHPFTNPRKLGGIRIRRVLNVCGDRDVWPIIASKIVPRAGASGSLFFDENSGCVINVRLSNCGHSDMLKSDVVRSVWIPFLLETSTASEIGRGTARLSRLPSMLHTWFWTIIVFAVGALPTVAYRFICGLSLLPSVEGGLLGAFLSCRWFAP